MRLTSHVLGSALVGLVACATFTNDICEYPGACPAQTMGDAAVDAPPVPGCDPRMDASCLSNARGVFVAAGGAAGGDGTQEKPLRTLAEALPLAAGMRNNIYICGEALNESVQITSNVNLFGGFACSGWSAGTMRTKVESAGTALEVSAGTVVISDLEFVSRDQAGATSAEPGTPGKSSIAAWIHSGATVTATRCAFRAGNGGGANAQGAGNSANLNGGPGANASAAMPGSGGSNATCSVGGGKGGVGGSSNDAMQSTHGSPAPLSEAVVEGRRGCNRNVVTNVGANKCIDGAGSCANGRDGAPGKGGTLTAATTSATLSDMGLVPSQGAAGAMGMNGGGGGGGGGGDQADRNGGGGGAGGCGGAGGKGGAAGGSSIAILVHNARFSGDATSEASSKDGGSGGKAQDGQPGGNGGAPGLQTAGGCSGGFGGNGGGGAAGQNGPGGLTAGIVFDAMSTVSWRGSDVRADVPAPSALLGGVSVGTPGASPLDVATGGAAGTGGAGPAGKGDDGLTGAAGKAGLALKL